MKIVAVTQSNYIPWKGYFDVIRACDHVIFLDDVQYTRRDWRNRNMIKTPQGAKWLTVPVDVKGKYRDIRVCDVEVPEHEWTDKHWNMIVQNYNKSPYFDEVGTLLKGLYAESRGLNKLSAINQLFIVRICDYLGVNTHFSVSTDHFDLKTLGSFNSTERLLKLCQRVDADRYISGPAAQNYMDVDMFEKEQIDVQWADYSGYKEYNQLYDEFTHGVSIIDLLMAEGKNSIKFMKNLNER